MVPTAQAGGNTLRETKTANQMAGENHLTYFKVQNFKRFKELEVKDIGQFNLVLGDNNVGKTSFLEALLVDTKRGERFLSNLLYALKYRGVGNSFPGGVLSFYQKREETKSDVKPLEIDFSIQSKKTIADLSKLFIDSITLAFSYDLEKNEIHFSRLDDAFAVQAGKKTDEDIRRENTFPNPGSLDQLIETHFVPFVSSFNGYNEELVGHYSRVLEYDKAKKKDFIHTMKRVLYDIDDFFINTTMSNRPIILCELKSESARIPLAMMGEGTVKLFRILSTITRCRAERYPRLMIDEIDTGIHYSRMKDFWKTILLAAKENDVQLFATTHNLECIKYFKEALEELSDLQDRARTITLVEHLQTKDILAHTSHFDVLESELALGNEVR